MEYRLATSKEIAKAQTWEGAPHVAFKCLCGEGDLYFAKNLTLNSDGAYNGCRNLFRDYQSAECSCSVNNLRYVVPIKE